MRLEDFTLVQCEYDIWDWFHTAPMGSYTHYYNRTVIFKTPDGVMQAYLDNLNNTWKI